MKNIYVCGPTVYSKVHIGNIRPILTFDIFIRSLRSLGEEVNFIHNITDIDDKIIRNAAMEKTSEVELSKKYAHLYFETLKQLNVEKPTHMPFVMDSMNEIIAFIQKLIEKGNAYEVDGNVYFDVTSIKTYGEVSNRKLDELVFEGGAGKRNPADFALWKKTFEGIQFISPWGDGRPGWHTECAVFIDKYAHGKSLDLHGGGIDLLFPHHENENVQYQAANDVPIAKEWKHVGHINLDGEKMSKSLGNIMDAQTFIDQNGVDTLRMIFLTSNVTSPLDITEEVIATSKEQASKFRKAYLQAQALVLSKDAQKDLVHHIAKEIAEWKFASAMKEVATIVKDFNKESNSENANKVIALMNLLGFAFTHETVTPEQAQLIDAWKEFRKEGKYKEADQIREQLIFLGLV